MCVSLFTYCGAVGLKGAWALRTSANQEYDTYLVLSFIAQTLILAAAEEELEKVEMPAFCTDKQTLYCGNASGNHIIQVPRSLLRSYLIISADN